MTSIQRYCLEVDPRSQAQVQAWLDEQGVDDVQVIAPGYMLALLEPERCEHVRRMQGVRRLLHIEEDVVVSKSVPDSGPVGAGFKVGDTVSIERIGFRVVGRIEDLNDNEARVVIALFGRALSHTVALTELRPVSIPEVWL